MTKQKGFLLPILLIVLAVVAVVSFYQSKIATRQKIHDRGVFIAKNINLTINYIQEYQLKKAKENKDKNVYNDLYHEFPKQLTNLKELGYIPNCVSLPSEKNAAFNCSDIVNSPFGGLNKIDLNSSVDHANLLININSIPINVINKLSEYTIRNNTSLTQSEKNEWQLLKQISALIPRSSFISKDGQQWLSIAIFPAGLYAPSAPSGLLQLDGKVKLQKDWDIGDHIMFVGNDNLQLTDGTKIGTDDIVIAAGIKSVESGKNTKINESQLVDYQYIDLNTCQKIDGTIASESNQYTTNDLQISAFISAIYPLVNTTVKGRWNPILGRHEPSSVSATLNNAFSNLGTFGLTYKLNYQYHRYSLNFYLMNYAKNSSGQNGFWGDNAIKPNLDHAYDNDKASTGASKRPVGANISFIVSCKRAKTNG